MAETEVDRNQPASPYKLAQARRRGQGCRSPEIVATVVLAAAMIGAAMCLGSGWRELLQLARRLMQDGLAPGTGASWQGWTRGLFDAARWLAPWFALLMGAAVVGHLVQGGFNLSLHPLKPDVARLSPVAGMRRLFSMRTLVEGGRAALKLVVLGSVLVSALAALWPALWRAGARSTAALGVASFEAAAGLGLRLVLAIGCLALVDLVYRRWEFLRSMRMSRREVQEEFRHREGDPRVRARLRQLRREMLRRSRSLQRVRDADLVLTNPTHVAVALRYRHGEMDAPVVIARGRGPFASMVRRVATRHGIPVLRQPTLARALYAEAAENQPIPVTLFPHVARVMVWWMAQQQARGGAAPGGGA